MTEHPLVSVVIPCYNQGCFLAEAIESVLAQTCRDVEIIVVNDGSSDNTNEVAAHYNRHVCYIKKPHGGLSWARNAGLQTARAEFIQFLDADDLLQPNKLLAHSEFLLSHHDVSVVVGDARYFCSETPGDLQFGLGFQEPWIRKRWMEPGTLLKRFLKYNQMPVNCPLVRREIIEKVGLFDESLPAVEDWDYWIRCAMAGASFQYYEAPDAMALIRTHSANMSRNVNRMVLAELRLRAKFMEQLIDPEERLANVLYGYASFRQFRFLKRVAMAREFSTCLGGKPSTFFYLLWKSMLDTRYLSYLAKPSSNMIQQRFAKYNLGE